MSLSLIAVIKKTELTKKVETQTRSPARKSVLKPAVRHPRPAQHHTCAKRKPTGDHSSSGGTVCNVAAKHQHLHLILAVVYSFHFVYRFYSVLFVIFSVFAFIRIKKTLCYTFFFWLDFFYMCLWTVLNFLFAYVVFSEMHLSTSWPCSFCICLSFQGVEWVILLLQFSSVSVDLSQPTCYETVSV